MWGEVHVFGDLCEMLQNPQMHAVIHICTGNISQINAKN